MVAILLYILGIKLFINTFVLSFIVFLISVQTGLVNCISHLNRIIYKAIKPEDINPNDTNKGCNI